MKRADEELCKAQFDAFVRRFSTPPKVTWEEVAQRDEPPDYYLLLDNTKFAVEVTTLIEVVRVGTSSPLPHFQIGRLFEQFVDKVEEIAKKEGYLRGNYLVSFSTPIDNFAAVQDRIQDKLLEYIRSTSGSETAPLETVFERVVPQQRPQQCGIQKLDSGPDRVVVGRPFWFKWEGEAAEGICDLLNESLNTKADKLKGVGEPVVLLLLDEYRFADRQMYEDCVHRLSSLARFHTVFIVQGSRGGFPLHSRNRDWLRQ
jgi:hypothetical protein